MFVDRFVTKKQRAGAHTVEFAIVLPIIVLLFMAGIEFVRMNLLRHVIDNASYEAARNIIVPGATVEEGITQANRVLASMGTKGANIVVTPNPITEDTGKVTVRVSVPAANNMWGLSVFSQNLSFESETTLLTERGPLQQSKVAVIPPPPPPPPPPEDPNPPPPSPPPPSPPPSDPSPPPPPPPPPKPKPLIRGL